MEEQGFIESRDEMERLLREEEIGYLGLSLNGKSYVVPVLSKLNPFGEKKGHFLGIFLNFSNF
jgi:nitroimidazol reductase NimA-like FMN-containing flavoprotein (pyridoxamine 5'-phosphate oxidase superfamily)